MELQRTIIHQFLYTFVSYRSECASNRLASVPVNLLYPPTGMIPRLLPLIEIYRDNLLLGTPGNVLKDYVATLDRLACHNLQIVPAVLTQGVESVVVHTNPTILDI